MPFALPEQLSRERVPETSRDVQQGRGEFGPADREYADNGALIVAVRRIYPDAPTAVLRSSAMAARLPTALSWKPSPDA